MNQVIDKFSFSYDAPVSLFLQLNDDYSIDKLDVYPFETRLEGSPIVIEMLRELPEFVQKTGFEEFYESNMEYYEHILNQAKQDSNAERVMKFINIFYKMDFSNNKFVVNLLPYTTYCNYGTNHNGIFYTNAGIKPEGVFFSKKDEGSLVLHEFSHSVINPLTSKYSKYQIEDFLDIKKQMEKKQYWDKETIINEHVIRSIELFYAKHVCLDPHHEEYVKEQEDIGFKYIRPCLSKIEEYYQNKDKYESFEEFYPEVLKAFEKDFQDMKEKK